MNDSLPPETQKERIPNPTRKTNLETIHGQDYYDGKKAYWNKYKEPPRKPISKAERNGNSYQDFYNLSTNWNSLPEPKNPYSRTKRQFYIEKLFIPKGKSSFEGNANSEIKEIPSAKTILEPSLRKSLPQEMEIENIKDGTLFPSHSS